MKAPLVIFAYNREDKLRECIGSLSEADGHDETEVFVFADGAKGEQDRAGVEGVGRFLEELCKENGFKELTVVKRPRNMGLAENVISGVSEVISKHGRVIVVEDDLTVTGDFLDFMNEALDYYEDDEKIWSVTGLSEPLKSLSGYGHDIYYSYRASSTGWGTWSDRWETVDWDMKRYEEVLSDKGLRKRFERGGRDMTRILKDQKMGLVDSWSIRWCLAQSLQDKYTVYPTHSFIHNSGYDSSGTNSPKPSVMNENPHTYGDPVKLEKLAPDERICRDFYDHYSGFWRRLIRNINRNGIKRQLKRLSGN